MVIRGELGIAERQETVDKDLDKFQGASRCAKIYRIANAITTDVDTSSVGARFMGLDLIDYFGVGNLFSMFRRNVFKPDKNKVSVPEMRQVVPFLTL